VLSLTRRRRHLLGVVTIDVERRHLPVGFGRQMGTIAGHRRCTATG
jgi:hypothetical protein